MNTDRVSLMKDKLMRCFNFLVVLPTYDKSQGQHNIAQQCITVGYPVAMHFNDSKHLFLTILWYREGYGYGGDHDPLLKKRESFWIYCRHCLPKVNDKLLLNVML